MTKIVHPRMRFTVKFYTPTGLKYDDRPIQKVYSYLDIQSFMYEPDTYMIDVAIKPISNEEETGSNSIPHATYAIGRRLNAKDVITLFGLPTERAYRNDLEHGFVFLGADNRIHTINPENAKIVAPSEIKNFPMTKSLLKYMQSVAKIVEHQDNPELG